MRSSVLEAVTRIFGQPSIFTLNASAARREDKRHKSRVFEKLLISLFSVTVDSSLFLSYFSLSSAFFFRKKK